MNNDFITHDIATFGENLDIMINILEYNILNNYIINENESKINKIKEFIIKILDNIWKKVKEFFKRLIDIVTRIFTAKIEVSIYKHESVYDHGYVLNYAEDLFKRKLKIMKRSKSNKIQKFGKIHNTNGIFIYTDIEKKSITIFNNIKDELKNQCEKIDKICNSDNDDIVDQIEDIISQIKSNKDILDFILDYFNIKDKLSNISDERMDNIKLKDIISKEDIIFGLYGKDKDNEYLEINSENIFEYSDIIIKGLNSRATVYNSIKSSMTTCKHLIEKYKITAKTIDELHDKTHKDLSTKYCTACSKSIDQIKDIMSIMTNIVTNERNRYATIVSKVICMKDNELEKASFNSI